MPNTQYTPENREAAIENAISELMTGKQRNEDYFRRSAAAISSLPDSLSFLIDYHGLDFDDEQLQVSSTFSNIYETLALALVKDHGKQCLDESMQYLKLAKLLQSQSQDAIDSAYLQIYLLLHQLKLTIEEESRNEKQEIQLFQQLTGKSYREIKFALKNRGSSQLQQDYQNYESAAQYLEPYISSEALAYRDCNPIIQLPGSDPMQPKCSAYSFVFITYLAGIKKLLKAVDSTLGQLPTSKQGKKYIEKFNLIRTRAETFYDELSANAFRVEENPLHTSEEICNVNGKNITLRVNYAATQASAGEEFLKVKKLFTFENEVQDELENIFRYIENYNDSESRAQAKLAVVGDFTQRRKAAYRRFHDEKSQLEAREQETELSLQQEQLSAPQQPRSIAEKMNTHRKVFLKMFEQPTPHHQLRYTELTQCVTAANGKVTTGKNGSGRKIHLYRYDNGIFNTQKIKTGVHEPHQGGHNGDKVDGNIVRSFQRAFSDAGITPETLWPQSTTNQI